MSDVPSYLHPRYARQYALRELGVVGQERLGNSRVLIVGAGGLGSPAAMYLAAAGVGTIGLVDIDVVDESNLHRQLLYGMNDVGTLKLDAAERRLQDINPLVCVQLHHTRIATNNAREIISQYDIVVDGTDNFPARYAINDACVMEGVPFVYGSVARFEGQVSVFAAPEGPCYRCLFPEEPQAGTVPNCAEDGVLGILPGIVGLHQSTEVIKWLTGVGRLLVGRLLMLDLLDHSSNEVALARDAECLACGEHAKWRVSTAIGSVANVSVAPANVATFTEGASIETTVIEPTLTAATPTAGTSTAGISTAGTSTAGMSTAGMPAAATLITAAQPTDAASVVQAVSDANAGAHRDNTESALKATPSTETGAPGVNPDSAPRASHNSAHSRRLMPESAPEIDVMEVAERLRSGEHLVLLDVREPWEFELAQLPDAVLVPLSSLPAAVNELDVDREYVVYCHHGTRSAMAANWLKSRGYQRVHNMTGGINAWSINVDRTVPQY